MMAATTTGRSGSITVVMGVGATVTHGGPGRQSSPNAPTSIVAAVSHPALWPLVDALLSGRQVAGGGSDPYRRAEIRRAGGTVTVTPSLAPNRNDPADGTAKVEVVVVLIVRESLALSLARGNLGIEALVARADELYELVMAANRAGVRVLELRAEALVGPPHKGPERAAAWLRQHLWPLHQRVSQDNFPGDARVDPKRWAALVERLEMPAVEPSTKDAAQWLRWLGGLTVARVATLPPLPHLAIWRDDALSADRGPYWVVAIAQVRDVAWTLESFVNTLVDRAGADLVLLLDTGSRDDTAQLVATLHREGRPVRLRQASWVLAPQASARNDTAVDQDEDETNEIWHEGLAYRELLDWARAEGATHVLTPDSDEYPTWNWGRHELLRHAVLSLPKHTALSVRLFHVYDGVDRWIAPPVPPGWAQVETACMGWRDDGRSHRTSNRRHHIPRVPLGFRTIGMHQSRSLGAVHLKFASLQGITIKTLWYRHLEFDAGGLRHALGSFYTQKVPPKKGLKLQPVPATEWYGPQEEDRAWAQRWTQAQAWSWRARMIDEWRAKWRREGRTIPPQLALPRDWKPATTTSPSSPSPPPPPPSVHLPPPADIDTDLDTRCRRRYATGTHTAGGGGGGKALFAELVRAGPSAAPFLWAVPPDHTMVRWLRDHEPHVREFVETALATTTNGSLGDSWVLDVGANSGYYGLMALAAGCGRALFVEPQPWCGALIEASLAANGWTARGQVLAMAAGNESSSSADRGPGPGMDVWCDTPCMGRMGAPGTEAPTGPEQRPDGRRHSVRLADHVLVDNPGIQVALLKIDVEGAEAAVLAGLRPLFASRAVAAATVEVTPLFYRQRGQEAALRVAIHAELEYVRQQGYDLWRATRAEPKTAREPDYRPVRDAEDLRQYLIQEAFGQHDVFIRRRHHRRTTP